MIIDINVQVGAYPFRALPHRTAAELAAHLEQNGITRALVSSLPAVFYRDTHRGNEEMYAETQARRDRLIPIATINPKYAGWERDLQQAVKEWGMKAVALYPEYHGYTLSDAHGRAVLTRVTELGVPVVLSQRLEDRRQRHAWDRAEDLNILHVLDAARAHPQLRFALTNWAGLDGTKLASAGLRGRCLIDFARLQVLLRRDVPKLIASLGVESVAFGSHAPFDYVGSSLVKLANLEHLPAADYQRIAARNAATFFGLVD